MRGKVTQTDYRDFFLQKDPYAALRPGAFVTAVRSNAAYHRQHCAQYARLLDACGFHPDMLADEDDLYRLPPIPTLYFKRNTLFSVPDGKLCLRATSSGTHGAKSSIGFDRKTLFYGVGMMTRFFSYYRVISPMPVNYIILGYEPRGGEEMGAIKTAYGTTKFAPALHRTYALVRDGADYRLNADGVARALEGYAKSGFPVRFVGFPSYLYFLMLRLQQRGVSLRLNKSSRVLLGGGWKQFAGEEIPRPLFYDMLKRTLNIESENCLEFFSAAEHPIPYVKCKNGHFHVPKYSRVLVRDASTLRPVGLGTPGLMNFITPMVGSMPLTSVITDDIGVLRDGEACDCGVHTPYFDLLGRAGAAQIKTCTAGAAQYLGGYAE